MRLLAIFLLFVLVFCTLHVSDHRTISSVSAKRIHVEVHVDAIVDASNIHQYLNLTSTSTSTEDWNAHHGSAFSALPSSSSLPHPKVDPDIRIRQGFSEWMKKFNKKYNIDEWLQRLQNFASNLLHLQDLHHRGHSWVGDVAGLDCADMSQQEFSQHFLGLQKAATDDELEGEGEDHHHGGRAASAISSAQSSTDTFDVNNPPIKIRKDKIPNFGRDLSGAQFPNGTGANFDWRVKNVLAPVQFQGRCGACVQFATAAVIEAAHAMKHGEVIKVSEEQFLDCTLGLRWGKNFASKCGGSTTMITLEYLKGELGVGKASYHSEATNPRPIYTWASYPYNFGGSWCKADGTPGLVDSGIRVIGKAPLSLSHLIVTMKDKVEFLMRMVADGPVAISVNGECLRYYSENVLDSNDDALVEKGQMTANHMVVLVGWGTQSFRVGGLFDRHDRVYDYWIVRNSWGSTRTVYGGYYYIMRGYNICGIENTDDIDRPIVK